MEKFEFSAARAATDVSRDMNPMIEAVVIFTMYFPTIILTLDDKV